MTGGLSYVSASAEPDDSDRAARQVRENACWKTATCAH